MTPEDIRRMRERAGHNQREAAAVIGVARNTWHRWENGLMGFKEAHLRIYAIKTAQPYPDDEKPSAR